VEKTGLLEIWQMISDYRELTTSNGFFHANRAEQRGNWMHEHVRFLLENRFYQDPLIQEKLKRDSPAVKSGAQSAIGVARELVQLFIDGKEKK
jgi:LAO/AO transport system kinase